MALLTANKLCSFAKNIKSSDATRFILRRISSPRTGIGNTFNSRAFIRDFANKSTNKNVANKSEKISILQWIIVGSGIVVAAKYSLYVRTAKCESVKVEIITPPQNEEIAKENVAVVFPWIQFFHLVMPYIIYLTVAIVTAMGVAMFNTKIGIEIGSLVNVLSSNLPGNRGDASGTSYLAQIKEPAMNILKYYVSHACLTFSYIYSLAIVGRILLITFSFSHLLDKYHSIFFFLLR